MTQSLDHSLNNAITQSITQSHLSSEVSRGCPSLQTQTAAACTTAAPRHCVSVDDHLLCQTAAPLTPAATGTSAHCTWVGQAAAAAAAEVAVAVAVDAVVVVAGLLRSAGDPAAAQTSPERCTRAWRSVWGVLLVLLAAVDVGCWAGGGGQAADHHRCAAAGLHCYCCCCGLLGGAAQSAPGPLQEQEAPCVQHQQQQQQGCKKRGVCLCAHALQRIMCVSPTAQHKPTLLLPRRMCSDCQGTACALQPFVQAQATVGLLQWQEHRLGRQVPCFSGGVDQRSAVAGLLHFRGCVVCASRRLQV